MSDDFFLDLGELDAPVLVFGGPYSNLQATRALIAAAEALGIPPGRWICTGDVCAYCADPRETAEAVKATGCAVVMGNCEESLGEGRDDCGCGFEEGAACDRFAMEWFAHADARLTGELRAWMRDCPYTIVFSVGGRRYAAIHGGAAQINRFHWPVAADAELAAEIETLEARCGPLDGVCGGHTGIPFERRIATPRGERHWLNAGAIGLPAHDGDPRTWFATLDGQGARLHRLDYNNRAAARAMRDAALSAGYDLSLETGWWPSEESFPLEMRVGQAATA